MFLDELLSFKKEILVRLGFHIGIFVDYHVPTKLQFIFQDTLIYSYETLRY